MKDKLEVLVQSIEQWAEDRNIIKGAKPIDQAYAYFASRSLMCPSGSFSGLTPPAPFTLSILSS